jgi:hypothetical protein
MKQLLERLKHYKAVITRVVLRALLLVLVLLLYVFGFGLTALYLLVFDRSRLFARPPAEGSWWSPARGYEADLQEWTHPS